MAIPTITAINPPLIHTGGRQLVEILGTGFEVPVIPPFTNQVGGTLIPTVKVTFGGEEPPKISIISSTRLLMEAPASSLPVVPPGYGEGSVDVVVQNLDAAGDPIVGEAATAVDGLEYQRPQLAKEGIITRVTRQMIKLLRLQVIGNVSTSTHTDFDDDTTDMLNITELADVPGIGLMGPELVENRFFSVNGDRQVLDPLSAEILIRRPPYTVDLNFTLVGVSRSMIELLNMMAVVQHFFERTKFLVLQKDPTDPSQGTIRYELDIVEGSDMKVFGRPNESNIRTFSGNFVIRGVDLEDIEGFTNDQVVDRTVVRPDEDVTLSVEQLGASFGVGPSPGDC